MSNHSKQYLDFNGLSTYHEGTKILHGYYNSSNGNFYKESTYTTLIAPQEKRLYVDLGSDIIYEYKNNAYVALTGTGNYNNLSNKPSINSVPLSGNKTTSELGLAAGDHTHSNASTANAGFMSASDKTKLNGIASGAQVNVIETIKVNNSALTPSSKAVNISVPTKVSELTNDSGYTTNTGTVTSVKVGSTSYNPESGVVSLPAYPTTLPASDVSAWAKASTKPSYSASEVGAIASTAKGTANGVAELDAGGKVPSSQLPSYVDDVVEVTSYSSLPTTGETGKIYVTLDTNRTYRWSGSEYVQLKGDLALGETSSTAYYGDRGKTAYDHSQLTSGNPHGVTKSDVGLSNVTNNKQVKGLASGTTSGHVVTWGTDGYTVADSGYTINKSVPSNAVFTDTNTIPSVYCDSGQNVAAKTASCTGFTLLNKSYLHVLIKNSNTVASALTLNVNSTGAKTIYINGTASSSTNYTLPAGTYLVYYASNIFYFRTDGKLTANITGSAVSANEASALDVTQTGSSIKPVYFSSSGVPVEISYTLGTACEKDVPSSGNASSTQVVLGNDSRLTDSRTPTSHTHGNISNGGTIISSTAVAPANGDYLLMSDTSNSSKVERGIAIGIDTSKYLRNDGTWVAPPNNNTTYTFANGTNGFTVTPSEGSAQTVTVTPSISNNVTGAAAWTAANVITTTNASSGNVIKASGKTIATSITDVDTTVPTSKAVKTYVDGLVANATHFKGGFAASGDGTIDGGSTTLKSVAEVIGDMYTCTTAGTLYGIAFEVGDSIIFKKAVTAGTAPATATGTPLTSTDFITVEGETSVSVVDNNPSLSWGTKSKVATIEGTEINVTMPSNPNTDTKVTSSANHYTPSTASGSDITKTASGATAAWSIDVVKGVTLNTDGKGHVTGMSVTSGKIPANPNTDTWRNIKINGTQQFSTATSSGALDLVDGIGTKAQYLSSTGTVCYNADLQSNVASTLGATAMGSTANRQYAVGLDSNNNLSVNIPWTDTKNTAGSTDTSSKIYLVGATSQAANPKTYSDNEVYATSGVLTTKSVQVGGTSATMQYNSTTQAIEFVFS